MKATLQIKYSLIILLVITLVMGTLTLTFVLRMKRAFFSILALTAKDMEDGLIIQLKNRAEVFVHLLSENLANPLYQYDMETIYDITKAARAQEEVVYVYIYEPSGRIVHDGTEEFLILDRILDDEVSKKAIIAKEATFQMKEDVLDIACPIEISNRLLGGVKIRFSLRGIKNDIEEMKSYLTYIGRKQMKEILSDIATIAGILFLVGLFFAIIAARGLTLPITLLSGLAIDVGSGRYDVDIPIERSDEIGMLAASFRRMLSDLKQKTTSIDNLNREIAERKRIENELKEAYNTIKEAQMKLIQSEKLASIGRVAAGVAHEINNPLSVISGEAEMLLKEKHEDKDTRETLKIVIEQVARIKSITESLLEVSRKRELKLELIDIDGIIEKSISALMHQVKVENIEIKKNLDSNLPKIWCDSSQIQEVFLNIMLNAVEAMEKKGKLTIRTYEDQIRKYGRRKTDIFKQGERIAVIEFSDTGVGMDGETLKKIFEPFFTTKEKNVGLGLFICHGVIANHNGVIEAHSKLGEGSTFVVKLHIHKKGEKEWG